MSSSGFALCPPQRSFLFDEAFFIDYIRSMSSRQLNLFSSIRARIAVAGIGIALTLAIALSFWAASISRDQIERDLGQAFAAHARHTVEMMDRGMFERFRDMQIAAEISDIRDPSVSLDQKRRVLKRLQTTFNAYAWIGICDAGGKGLVGTDHYLEGKDLSQRPWCTKGRSGPYVGDVHDALLLAKILPNPAHRDFYLLDVAAPVHRPDGSLLGVVCGHIFWDWAVGMLNSVEHSGEALLLSRDGMILAGVEKLRSDFAAMAPRTSDAIRRAGTSTSGGYMLETWSNGKTYLAGFATGKGYRDYPGLGWSVVYRQDAELAFAPAADLQKAILFGGLVLGLVFAAIGYIQAERIARPIEALTRAARETVANGFAYQPPSISQQGEIRELADAIEAMTQTLSSQSREKQALLEQLAMISMAVEQAGEGILITDKSGVIEYVNPACCEITGYAPEELIGQTPAILKSGEQQAAMYEQMWDTILAGKVWNGSLIDRRKDGSHIPLIMSIAPITDETGEITHFVAIQQDMSDYKKLESQFLQSQKMEALGTLVGGIAHDFNNMLAGITGNLFIAKRVVQDCPDAMARLDIIEKLAFRASEMIQQLLSFARKDQIEKQPFELRSFLKEISKLNQAAIPESTRLHTDFGTDELVILGSPTQMQQAILNLMTNAQHAVENRPHPEIRIHLGRIEADAAFRQSHPEATADSYAHIEIRDNGHGIQKEHLEHIFEPFFTTKEVGKGTGLGLPMVYGTVKNHDGILEVESEPGVGTAFHLYLPLADQADAANDHREKKPSEIAGAGETLLLADDEAELLATVAEALEPLGYRILTADNGRSACDLFRQHPTDINLAILDVVMPETGGLEAAKCMWKQRPELPVIFMTGYDMEQTLNAGKLPGHCVVLQKPVKIGELGRHIRQLLEA